MNEPIRNTQTAQTGIHVSSETAMLRKVLIHRPDYGIERITPESAVELLYEDIVHLPKMVEEHDLLTEVLSFFIGRHNVVETEEVLRSILSNGALREALLREVALFENLSPDILKELLRMDASVLASVLISGTDPAFSKKYFNPLPNFIFTRDIGVVINRHLLVGKAAKTARMRESILSRYIFRHFNTEDQTTLIELPDRKELSIEGGDIMMLAPGHLLVASSERTTEAALDYLIQLLFDRDIVQRVSRVALPKLRYCMHLDTIFTRFDEHYYTGFAPLVSAHGNMPAETRYADGSKQRFASLKELLLAEDPKTIVIPSGGGISPFAEREQWTDSCNLFAIRNGVAFTYDRNYHTNITFQQHGYSLIEAAELIDQFKSGEKLPEHVQKTIITIPSSELSRARGGPHCMTMPLVRD